ncbi:MAG TPA: 7-carboxy-7-deazaguanine synthase QueE [Planctomycetota bacterium]|nr:7-carboxy-7-deazaguanine synthase QueE [Planctomycetota bacterium]
MTAPAPRIDERAPLPPGERAPLPPGERAPLVEVFASIQGEGAYVGEPQTFVRLAVCPLRCRYCDSESTWEATDTWLVARADGEVERRPNPADVKATLDAIASAEGGAPRTVSITGGEPLAHPEFVAELARELRAQGRRVHLETAGVHAGALAGVLPAVDHVSADLKLRSTMETGDFFDSHRRFLAACASAHVDTCVKCVVTPKVADEEMDEAASLVASVDPDLLFVVQPATPMRLEPSAISNERVDALVARARRRLRRVRVIPQVHRAMGRS